MAEFIVFFDYRWLSCWYYTIDGDWLVCCHYMSVGDRLWCCYCMIIGHWLLCRLLIVLLLCDCRGLVVVLLFCDYKDFLSCLFSINSVASSWYWHDVTTRNWCLCLSYWLAWDFGDSAVLLQWISSSMVCSINHSVTNINTGRFIMYSGITKIYYRKTARHVFTKPVQIEGTTQHHPLPPTVSCFFIVVHISTARRCECM